jgi:hypothetical protein
MSDQFRIVEAPLPIVRLPFGRSLGGHNFLALIVQTTRADQR